MTIGAPSVEAVAIGPVNDPTRAALLACWTDVSNAGGCVGFVPPVAAAEIEPVLDTLVDNVRRGRDTLVALRAGEELIGFAVLSLSDTTLCGHVATVQRVQIRPEHQGRGLGAVLMRGVHTHARRLGLQMLRLTVRGGSGREGFYRRLGYVEFGRLPGGFQLGPDDFRDEIHMYALV